MTTFYCLAVAGAALGVEGQLTVPDSTNATVRHLSRMECIALALEHNLEIRVARHEPRIAHYNLRGTYAYYEPTLNASVTHAFSKSEGSYDPSIDLSIPGARQFNNAFNSTFLTFRSPYGSQLEIGADASHIYGTRGARAGFGATNMPVDVYTGAAGVTFRQDLLRNFWTDAGRLTIQLNRRALKMAEFMLENRILQTVATTEQAYYALIAAVENVRVAEVSLQLNEQLLSETRQRVKVGVAVPLDEKQVESDVASARAALIKARLDLANSENDLKRLLADDYGDWYQVQPLPSEKLLAIPEAYNLNESWLMGISLRPDYNQAKLQVEMKGLEVKYAHNQLFPTLQFVATYGRSGNNEDGSFADVLADVELERNARYSFGGVLSIPLGNTDARNRHKARKEQMEQLKNQLRLLHLDILVSIEKAVNTARAAYEAAGATREARIFAEAALDAERKKMENGKSTSYFVLDFQRQLTEKRYGEIAALAAYNTALSELYRREGSTLQRNRIDLQYK
ncbi:MAG: TolC family protein [Verrucomicrobia bacterium]|nr:TolC family protein [Verrucomicrobiota bacterium]